MTPDDYSKLADELHTMLSDYVADESAALWLARNLDAIEAALRLAAQAQECVTGTVMMSRDLVISIRSYVVAKRDKQAAMGLNYGATDLLLSRIDAALAAEEKKRG